jgi:hypothetical protein
MDLCPQPRPVACLQLECMVAQSIVPKEQPAPEPDPCTRQGHMQRISQPQASCTSSEQCPSKICWGCAVGGGRVCRWQPPFGGHQHWPSHATLGWTQGHGSEHQLLGQHPATAPGRTTGAAAGTAVVAGPTAAAPTIRGVDGVGWGGCTGAVVEAAAGTCTSAGRASSRASDRVNATAAAGCARCYRPTTAGTTSSG